MSFCVSNIIGHYSMLRDKVEHNVKKMANRCKKKLRAPASRILPCEQVSGTNLAQLSLHKSAVLFMKIKLNSEVISILSPGTSYFAYAWKIDLTRIL